jgi:hypothetical protein
MNAATRCPPNATAIRALVLRTKIERGLRLPMRAKRVLLLRVIIRRRLPGRVSDVPFATS